jgi:hypothetical protein
MPSGPWVRHTIDAASRGADGVKLADVNGDGLPDVVTGWEEGGDVRVCLHPGHAKAKAPWPSVSVGRAPDVEDAVFADLDGDGTLDVVSCCEGNTKRMNVHWGPKDRSKLLDPAAWSTEPFPPSEGVMRWMFCIPLQIDGKHGVDLIAGGKNEGAKIGWFEAPSFAEASALRSLPATSAGSNKTGGGGSEGKPVNPRDLDAWTWHPLLDVGWVMSLFAADMDGDGDMDIAASDRKGADRGCLWLENPGPGPAQAKPWAVHRIAPVDGDPMFMTLADLDGDGLRDVLASVKPRMLAFYRRLSADGRRWERSRIDFPENSGTAKGVAVGDLDGDGRPEIVFTCEEADGPKSGVWRLSPDGAGGWTAHDVGGPDGTKFDLVELLDLDGDGDLDAMTCEERDNLGVFWYENPLKK